MRYYRQHPIILFGALLESVLLASIGITITLFFAIPLALLLIVLALVIALWRVAQWATFSLRVDGHLVTLRSLRGFVIDEQRVSISSLGDVRLRQGLSGYFLDYGFLRIETLHNHIQVRYLAPFSSLRHQIERP